MTQDRLFQWIAADYSSLSRQLQAIARYLEQNRGQMMLARINDVAAACDVHPSAVVRFAKRFGLSGFAALKAMFKEQFRIQGQSDANSSGITPASLRPASRVVAASRASLLDLDMRFDEDGFQNAVGLLSRAERVYLLGLDGSLPVASYLASALQRTARQVVLVTELGGVHRNLMRSASSQDTIVAISRAPYGSDTEICVLEAHRRGACVVALVDSRLSPLASLAAASLVVRETKAFPFAITSTLCVCEALVAALASVTLADGSAFDKPRPADMVIS
ncbi:MurR/RpiR family transcriptional regulator [Paraburkholderia sp. BL10I2N1]|uniref:MurR/RpiR family transcriptional regulator n=1 Tax=Paraburkholderia sp. BL10I2N1 TaxID=1938796 RepID=UPI001414E065|nr:MurR/RpiR family transcriptional regulator [Paraburkholderia sp. BL10I2N1]